MTLKSKFIFVSFLLVFILNKASAYVIFGQLKGYSSNWNNTIYLSAIRFINDFQSASSSLLINEAKIDQQGNFKLQGNNLPDENLFYRVYLINNTNGAMLNLTEKDQNFFHIVLNNNSDVEINVNLEAQPFYFAQVKGSANASYFNDFYKNIYHLNDQNFNNAFAQINLNDNKYFELTKNSITKINNPYYSIFALAQIDWKSQYASNSAFFEKSVSDLKKQLPDNQYVLELANKLQVMDFQTSRFKDYLTLPVFITLLSFCFFSLLVGLILAFRLYRKSHTVSSIPVSTEKLTQKELEIARLVVQGKSNKEIAILLFIEISTVKTHISNIYQKLSIASRKELTARLNPS